jgi:hypothetical protein
MSTYQLLAQSKQVSYPSNLIVASALIYPSGDGSALGKMAREFVVYRIKQDQPVAPKALVGAIAFTVDRMKTRFTDSPLGDFFRAGGALVPVPGHACLATGALWPAKRICEEMIRNRIGDEVMLCLQRTQTVSKSATARPGERPGPDNHYESISCSRPLRAPSRLILVDDVVTRGATLIACARHLREHFPDVEIVAFAIARVDRDARMQDMTKILDPKVETITYDTSTGRLLRS